MRFTKKAGALKATPSAEKASFVHLGQNLGTKSGFVDLFNIKTNLRADSIRCSSVSYLWNLMKGISAITFMAYASVVANVFALVNDIDSINESFFRFNPMI